MTFPPNILGTGVLPPAEEEQMRTNGAKYAYFMDSATPGNPPVLIVYYREPEEWLSDLRSFERKSGFSLSDVVKQASASGARPASPRTPDANPEPVPAV